MRILISVPQANAQVIHVGQQASVGIQELPNLKFPGTVTRTSNSLSEASRTLLTEVQVSNPQRRLLPGMYALVEFNTIRVEPPFLVPDPALVTRANGTFVVVLEPLTAEETKAAREPGTDADALARTKRAHFVAVQPGRDYGTELEILSGLQG